MVQKTYVRVGFAHPPAQGSRVVHPRACSRELIVARALVVVSCPGTGTSSPRKNTPFPAKDVKNEFVQLLTLFNMDADVVPLGELREECCVLRTRCIATLDWTGKILIKRLWLGKRDPNYAAAIAFRWVHTWS